MLVRVEVLSGPGDICLLFFSLFFLFFFFVCESVNLEKKTTHKFLSAAEAAGPFEMKKNFGEEEEVNHAGRYNGQRFSLFYLLCV